MLSSEPARLAAPLAQDLVQRDNTHVTRKIFGILHCGVDRGSASVIASPSAPLIAVLALARPCSAG
eukprot:scaffold63567_cov30-Phaeocystis_antarctica.AAC.1